MDTPESKLPAENGAEEHGKTPAASDAVPVVSPEMLATPAEPQAGAPQAVPPASQLPEDLRAPWGWMDLVIFLFFGLGSLIVMSQVAAVMVMILFRTTPAGLEKLPTAQAAFATLSQAMWSAVVMLYLLAVTRVRFDAPFWRTLGWRPLRVEGVGRAQAHVACVLGGSVFAIVIQMSSALLRPDVKLPIENLFRSRESILMLMGMGILVAPLVEETIFRGFLYPVLARSLGVAGGVILTGMLFGLMHASQLWGGWGQIGLLMIVGIVFTYVRARTGTVLAPYLLHLGYNSILFLAFYVGTSGLRYLPD